MVHGTGAIDLAGFLDRIGYRGPVEPTVAADSATS